MFSPTPQGSQYIAVKEAYYLDLCPSSIVFGRVFVIPTRTLYIYTFGFTGAPDVQLQPKKKVWETLAPDLKVNKEKVATFRGDPLVIEGKGALTAPSLKDVQIK